MSLCRTCCLPPEASWKYAPYGRVTGSVQATSAMTTSPSRNAAAPARIKSTPWNASATPRAFSAATVSDTWLSATASPGEAAAFAVAAPSEGRRAAGLGAKESNTTGSARRRTSRDDAALEPAGAPAAANAGVPRLPAASAKEISNASVPCRITSAVSVAYATPNASSVGGYAAASSRASNSARHASRTAFTSGGAGSARDIKTVASRPPIVAMTSDNGSVARNATATTSPTEACFAAVTTTSSESTHVAGARGSSGERYATFTTSTSTSSGGVASKITSALSAPRGVSAAMNPRVGSVNAAGGAAVTLSCPSAKPCAARSTNVASQKRPAPTTSPGRTGTPFTAIVGLSMGRPLSTRTASASPTRATLLGVEKITEPSAAATEDSAGLEEVTRSVVTAPYSFITCTPYVPSATPRPVTAIRYSVSAAASKSMSPHRRDANAPQALWRQPAYGGKPNAVCASFSAVTVIPSTVTALSVSVTPAAALSVTVTAVPAASRPVSNPASPAAPPAGDGNDQSPRETATPSTVVVAAYLSAPVASVLYARRTSYRASTSSRQGVNSNEIVSSSATVTADAAMDSWSLVYIASSLGNVESHARMRSFCAYETSCLNAKSAKPPPPAAASAAPRHRSSRLGNGHAALPTVEP